MEKINYEPKKYLDIDLRNKSGIYQIRNLVNNKIYIGSSINLRKREKEHFRDLKNCKHHSKKLQRAFNKYGEQNFIFEIIEFIEDKSKLLEHEQYWMDRFNVVKKGYNICSIAGSALGRKHSKQSRLKLSLLNKGERNYFYNKHMYAELNPFYGKKHTEETKLKISKANSGINNGNYNKTGERHHLSRKVVCIETNTIYGSTREAERLTNVHHSHISKCCKDIYKTAGGYHWTYVNEF